MMSGIMLLLRYKCVYAAEGWPEESVLDSRLNLIRYLRTNRTVYHSFFSSCSSFHLNNRFSTFPSSK